MAIGVAGLLWRRKRSRDGSVLDEADSVFTANARPNTSALPSDMQRENPRWKRIYVSQSTTSADAVAQIPGTGFLRTQMTQPHSPKHLASCKCLHKLLSRLPTWRNRQVVE